MPDMTQAPSSEDALAASPLVTPQQAVNNSQMSNASAPQAPYQGDATADMLAANGATPSQPAQPKRSALKSMLLNFAEGMGKSLQYQAGVPQFEEAQAQAQIKQAQVPYAGPTAQATLTGQQIENKTNQRKLDALQNIGDQSNITAPLGQLSPDEQAIMNSGIQQLKLGNLAGVSQAVQHITAMRAISNRTTRSDATVTPEMVQQYPALAPFVGKPITPSQVGAISRGEAINNVFSNTAAGPIVVPKSGPNAGQAKPVTLNGKGIISNQEAGAYWQARYGVVQSQDENGPVFMRRIDAPGAPTANSAFQIFKGKAGLDNFKDALTRINDNLDVMNDPTQKALVARTLRNIGTQHDPGIVASLIGSEVAQGLDPKAADLVAATLNAREWIGSNRAFAGNFQGSEALYNRMVANVAGPMNSPEVNRALIKQDLNNTSKIEDKITKYQGARTPSAPASSGGGKEIHYKIVNGQLVKQ